MPKRNMFIHVSVFNFPCWDTLEEVAPNLAFVEIMLTKCGTLTSSAKVLSGRET